MRKREKLTLFVATVAVLLCGTAMLVWGQYNSAVQVYEIAFTGLSADELLKSDEQWQRTQEEQEFYELRAAETAQWAADNAGALRHGEYIASSASAVYPKAPLCTLSYDFYDNDSSATIVLLHSYLGNTADTTQYAPFWWAQGYNVLIPQLRAHTEADTISGITTFGVYEQYDLLDLLSIPELTSDFALHGRGIGAAAAIYLAANTNIAVPAIRFIIAESIYSTLKELELNQLSRQFGLGDFLVGSFLDRVIESECGFAVSDADIMRAAASDTTPILFISSESESLFLGANMTESVFNASAAPAKKWLEIPEVRRSACYLAAADIYHDEILLFLSDLL